MGDVVRIKCRVCGARVSGVRTEFGSLIVPGRKGCPRCGAAKWAEVACDAEEGAKAGDEGTTESTTETEADSSAEE